jgi:uncharacterized phage protein (TIGR01671 family)
MEETQKRELSFRAWHEEKEYMYENIAIGLMEKILYSRGTPKKKGPDWYVSEEHSDAIHVMQYTGLKDDKKKKIFEGDVLAIGAQDKVAEVFWSNENARFEIHFLEDDREIDFADKRSLRQVKVIGNIYENPELVGREPKEKKAEEDSEEEEE